MRTNHQPVKKQANHETLHNSATERATVHKYAERLNQPLRGKSIRAINNIP